MKKIKKKKTTTLKLETRNEFELTSPTSTIISRSTHPTKNSSSDYYIKEIPNTSRITKASSLTAYIETSTPSTASTSTIVRTTSMPSTIDHDSSDSDLGERELYPLGDSKNYKKVSAESTNAISSRYLMNDITKNKSKARAGLQELREGKKKNNQLKQEKKNSDQFKKKKILQKKQKETKKQSNMMEKRFITKKPRHDTTPDSSPNVFTSPSCTVSTDISTEDEIEVGDDAFDCLDRINHIEAKSFVAYKEIITMTRESGKRAAFNTNYVIAQVQEVIDDSSYVLKFLRFEKNGRLLSFYTWDEQRQYELVSNKKDLVLLQPPKLCVQPKDAKQGAKILAKDIPHCINKYIFNSCLIETVRSHFENE